MVVTRKTTVPMPPASRTSSTTSTPKLNKGKLPQRSALGDVQDSPRTNGVSPATPTKYIGPQSFDDALFTEASPPRKSPKDKTKGKSKKKAYANRHKPPSSWLDFFSRMFIFAFLIYSLTVCPQDKEQSIVCRGLTEYRRLILEPYIITPVLGALHHPSVSPYTTPVINVATPIITRTQKEWTTRVVPNWNNRAVPILQRTVVPQWNKYAAPQIAKLAEIASPYREAASEKLSPYVAHAQRAALRTQPILLKAAAKTYDGFQYSKPYMGKVFVQLQHVGNYFVKYAYSPLIMARRQFVDPHVALLFDKVKELSSGSSKSIRSDSVTDEKTFTASTVKEAEGSGESVTIGLAPVPELSKEEPTLASAASVISASAYLGESQEESVPGATYSPAVEDEVSAASLSSILASSSSQPQVVVTETAVEVETVVVEEVVTSVVQRVETVVASPVQVTETVVVEEVVTETIANTEAAYSEVPVTAAEEDSPEAEVTSGEIALEPPKAVASDGFADFSVPSPHRPVSVPHSNHKEAIVEDDLDDFVAELGLDEEDPEPVEPISTPEAVPETPEEKAAREAEKKAMIAEKRKKIMARHAVWEDKLAAAIESQSVVLRRAIIALRKSAVVSLKSSTEIHNAIGTFDSEAQKALRGTQAYIAKLKESGKSPEEQSRLFERVIDKVKAKVEARMKEVEEVVNKWYQQTVLEKEDQEIQKVSGVVREAAEVGQADVGLDYAWLEDVTYNDWRRYHAMMDKHTEFLQKSLSLVNGSHPQAFANPVADALQKLQEEVEEIVVGFETRLRQIREEGNAVFSSSANGKASETGNDAPDVSILPIVGDGTRQGKSEENVLQEVSDAILGRSAEEVVEAVGKGEKRIEVEAQTHDEL